MSFLTYVNGRAAAGVAERDSQTAIEAADQALYKAKAAGRNCVVDAPAQAER